MIKYICVVGFSCQLEITSRMQDAKYGLMSRPAIRLVPSKYWDKQTTDMEMCRLTSEGNQEREIVQ